MAIVRVNGASYRNVDEEGIEGSSPYLLNCYGNEANYLVKRPGLERVFNLGAAKVDGMYLWKNMQTLIALCGGKVFQVNPTTFLMLDRTSDAPLTGTRATFTDNGTTVYMANGGKMLTLGASGNSTFVPDATAPTIVTHVDYLDGYILANQVGTQQCYYTDASSPGTWTALNFALANTNPDLLLAIKVHKRLICMFGSDSIEFWVNDGVNPFSRVYDATVDLGTSAPYSITSFNDFLFFLDKNRRPMMTGTGGDYKYFGKPYQRLFDNLGTVTDCSVTVIHSNGQDFLMYNFPTDNVTYSYNASLDRWFESSSINPSTGAKEMYRGWTSCDSSPVQYGLTEVTGNYAGTVADNAAIGTVAWSNPTKAQGTASGDFAQVEFSAAAAVSHYLKCTNFGFSIPSNARITGIVAAISTINPYALDGGFELGTGILGNMDITVSPIMGTVFDTDISLIVGGAVAGSNRAKSAVFATNVNVTYGSSIDTWGNILSATVVNNSNFGIALSYTCDTYTFAGNPGEVKPFVDVAAISLIVFYSIGEVGYYTFSTLVGDKSNGNVYISDESIYTDNGDLIECIFRNGNITHNTMRTKKCNVLRLWVKTSPDIYGVNPVLKIRMLDNGGVYSNYIEFPLYGNGEQKCYEVRSLGLYKTRQYEGYHMANAALTFVALEDESTARER